MIGINRYDFKSHWSLSNHFLKNKISRTTFGGGGGGGVGTTFPKMVRNDHWPFWTQSGPNAPPLVGTTFVHTHTHIQTDGDCTKRVVETLRDHTLKNCQQFSHPRCHQLLVRMVFQQSININTKSEPQLQSQYRVHEQYKERRFFVYKPSQFLCWRSLNRSSKPNCKFRLFSVTSRTFWLLLRVSSSDDSFLFT